MEEGCRDPEGLSIRVKEAKRVVIKEFGIQYLGTIGTFELCGQPEILNILQACGLGSRRNAGNGLFKVIC